jgi:hypothetical protein
MAARPLPGAGPRCGAAGLDARGKALAGHQAYAAGQLKSVFRPPDFVFTQLARASSPGFNRNKVLVD